MAKMSFVTEAVAPRERVEQSLKFEDNVGLVHLQAKIGHRMCAASGMNIDYQDVFQEASLAFLLAAEGFDPDHGVTFSAYYTKAAFSAFRKFIGVMTGVKNLNEDQRGEIIDRRAENKRRGLAGEKPLPDMSYGIRPMQFSELGYEEGDGDPFVETLQSETASPEDIVSARQQWERATAQLSPLAQLVVDWLRDPPPELVRELQCQVAQANEYKARGVRTPKGLRERGLDVDAVSAFVRLLAPNVRHEELVLVKKELMDVVKELG